MSFLKSKTEEQKIKKGTNSWKPASLNEFENKESGYRYRMVRKDPDNLARKRAEGWEPVSGINNPTASYQDPNKIEQGKGLTSVNEGKDWILHRMPEELAKQRDEYFDKKSKDRVKGLTAHLKSEMSKTGTNAPLHGEIKIDTKYGTQIID